MKIVINIMGVALVISLMMAQSYGYYHVVGHSTKNTIQAATAFALTTPTPMTNPNANHIVISEVQIGEQSANDDFIELYNPTAIPVSLQGLRIVKRTSTSIIDSTIITLSSSHTIAPHGFFLWAHRATGELYADRIHADASSSATLAANNSVAIKDIQSGAVIDALAWGNAVSPLSEGTPFTNPIHAGQSMERKARAESTVESMTSGVDETRGNGYDSDHNAFDFIIRGVGQPQRVESPPELP